MPQFIRNLSGKFLYFILIFCAVFVFSVTAYAASNPQFTQQISSGTLGVDIVDGSYVSVGSPTVVMSTVNFSAVCETSTGTLGSVSQKIYIENPDQADNGWTVSMAATGGVTSVWDNQGAGADYDFNDGSGCTDGADADSLGGQMTVDPSVANLANGLCVGCSTTGVSLGASSAFVQGTTNSITLLSASASANDVADYTVTGIGISQTIPAAQPVGTYQIDMTITITAL